MGIMQTTYNRGNTVDMESVLVSKQNSGYQADDICQGKYCRYGVCARVKTE